MNSKIMIALSLVSGVALGLLIIFVVFRKPQPVYQQAQVPITPAESPAPPVEPTAVPTVKGTSAEWMSPDGTKTLIMKSVLTPEDQNTYSFFVRDTSVSESEALVYTKTIPKDSTMSIPFNSWAPGNQFFFVQEHDGENTQNIVLKTKGTLFSNQEAALNVNEQFVNKGVKYMFGETTGWAAPTLLIVNTKTTEEEQGPTFWFDVNRLTFQQLSTKF